tara:strand:+ start:185 stop:328 length:144 start_codon:yes stop_codon:yes gene_type:complete
MVPIFLKYLVYIYIFVIIVLSFYIQFFNKEENNNEYEEGFKKKYKFK